MNILVIDDNHCTSGAIADYCDMNEIYCEEVNDGKTGLSAIQKQDYDLIILDIAMPEFTGLDILSQLKMQRISNRNIVVLTATNLKKRDFDIYKEIGIIRVLYKPITLAQLDKTIRNSIPHVVPVNQLTVD